MRLTLHLVSIALLVFIATSDVQPVLTSLSWLAAEDAGAYDYGEKETGSEEREDDSREEIEKFFADSQQVECSHPASRIPNDFIYRISIKANLHFEVIIPPPQLFC